VPSAGCEKLTISLNYPEEMTGMKCVGKDRQLRLQLHFQLEGTGLPSTVVPRDIAPFNGAKPEESLFLQT
jgi:hypothetical protein